MRKKAKKIGERHFPLEVSEDEVKREHDLIDSVVEVSPFASPHLQEHIGKSGKICGIFERWGQVAGYEIACEGEVLLGTKKDFYIGRNLLRNPHLQSSQALRIREGLSEWLACPDFVKGDLASVQAFFWDLASLTSSLSVSLTWTDDSNSLWEFQVPSTQDDVVVKSSNSAHDGVWSLSVQVYSTREEAKEPVIEHADHWSRTLLWTHRCLELVGAKREKYRIAVLLSQNSKLTRLAQKVFPEIAQAYGRLYEEAPKTPPLSLGFSDWRVQPGHVGLYEPPTEVRPYGVLSIHPKALKKGAQYLTQVVKHELIHYAMAEVPFEDPHGEEFQRLADMIGLPEKLQD